ncbi:MAG: hypothetical protein NTX63_04605 [Candidatus Peregrinibacteria bacterium]|nr:hypothetical protein [Candidatus Peregrinibacteria bacterium]
MTIDCGDRMSADDDEMWQRLQDIGDTRQSRINEAAARIRQERDLQRHVSSLSEDVRSQVIKRLQNQGFLFIEQVQDGPVPRDSASTLTDLGNYITTLPIDIRESIIDRLQERGFLFPEEN